MTTEYAAQPSTTIWNSVEAADYLRIHPRTLKRMLGTVKSLRFRSADSGDFVRVISMHG
jgi:ribulose bisphosphate carboxylase small subunit